MRQRLVGEVPAVHMPARETLYKANQPIRNVYFPLTGVMSLVSILETGDTIEAGAVGYEGMVGLPVLLGTGRSNFEASSQVPGYVIPVPAATLRAELDRSDGLRDVLNRYAQVFMTQLGQTIACNAHHAVQQRASRWLLMTHDRMRSDEFLLTQEVLAQMLGVRVATVSETAHSFQQAGLISYQRGRMTIIDRPGLEARACRCYRILVEEYARAMGS